MSYKVVDYGVPPWDVRTEAGRRELICRCDFLEDARLIVDALNHWETVLELKRDLGREVNMKNALTSTTSGVTVAAG